jgi:hypothetical protein
MCNADTIKSGIANVSLFSATPDLLLYGMFCVMIAAAFWCALSPSQLAKSACTSEHHIKPFVKPEETCLGAGHDEGLA